MRGEELHALFSDSIDQGIIMATSSDNKQQGSKTSSNAGSSGGSKQSDTSKRGFASMDPAQQREIASEGGVPPMKGHGA
jgi:hypothetical protein